MEPRITLTLDCCDPEKLVAFWTDALGYESPGGFGEFWPLFPPRIEEPVIVLQRVEEARAGKNRMHLDIHVDDLATEVERLEALGAQRLSESTVTGLGHEWLVLADPEGNEFCVVRRPAAS